MSKDGYLPDGVSERDLPGGDEFEHSNDCPAGEDGPELFSECGGLGKCECHPDTLWGRIVRRYYVWKFGDEVCTVVKDPECTCPSAQEIAEERAEARQDAMEDR